MDFSVGGAVFRGMAGRGKLANGAAVKAAPHSRLLECGYGRLPVCPDADSSRVALGFGAGNLSFFALTDDSASAESRGEGDAEEGCPSGFRERFGALGMQCQASLAGLELSGALAAASGPGPGGDEVLGRGGESLFCGLAARHETDRGKAALWVSARIGHFVAPGAAGSIELEIPGITAASAAEKDPGAAHKPVLNLGTRLFLFAASHDYSAIDGSEPAYDFLARADLSLSTRTWSAEVRVSAGSAFGAPEPGLLVRKDAGLFRCLEWYLSIDSVSVAAGWKGFGAALSSAANIDPQGIRGLRFAAGYGAQPEAFHAWKADLDTFLSFLREGSNEGESGEDGMDSGGPQPEGGGPLAFSSLRLRLKGEWAFPAAFAWLGAGKASIAVRIGAGGEGKTTVDISVRQDFRFGNAIAASLAIASPPGGLGKGKFSWPALSLSCRIGGSP